MAEVAIHDQLLELGSPFQIEGPATSQHSKQVLMITDESLIAPHVQLYILKEKDQRICAPALKPPQVNTINNLVFPS